MGKKSQVMQAGSTFCVLCSELMQKYIKLVLHSESMWKYVK